MAPGHWPSVASLQRSGRNPLRRERSGPPRRPRGATGRWWWEPAQNRSCLAPAIVAADTGLGEGGHAAVQCAGGAKQRQGDGGAAALAQMQAEVQQRLRVQGGEQMAVAGLL